MTSVHADKPSMVVKTVKQLAPNKIVRIVFIALLLDLLAFTMPWVDLPGHPTERG